MNRVELARYHARRLLNPFFRCLLVAVLCVQTGNAMEKSEYGDAVASIDWLSFYWNQTIDSEDALVIEKNVNLNGHPFRYDRYLWKGYQFFKRVNTDHCMSIYTGRDLMFHDWRDLLQQASESMGQPLEAFHISRVDFTIDVEGETPFLRLGDVYTRARRSGTWEGQNTSLYFGSAPCLLRIYDKIGKIRASGKLDELEEYRLHYGLKGDVCRVEFEVLHEKLRGIGIRNAADLLTGYKGAFSYLVRDWFFVPEKKWKSRKRNDNPSALWAAVLSAIEDVPRLSPVEKQVADCSHLINSALGTMRAAYGVGTFAIPDKAHFKEWALRKLEEWEPQDSDWETWFDARKR